MRLNKASQYGMLLSLYLARAGKATVSSMVDSLNLKYPFAVQIASKLKEAGVFGASRGPTGGYELKKGATVLDVITACGESPLITRRESAALNRGVVEKRAMVNYLGAVSFELNKLLATEIRHISDALVQQELQQLDSASPSQAVQ